MNSILDTLPMVDGRPQPPPAAPPDPADLGLAGRINAAATASGDPTAAGKANILGRQAGLPADMVQDDPAPATALIRQRQAATAIDANPKLGDWSANPRNAAVAHDDFPTLAKIGDIIGGAVATLFAPGAAARLIAHGVGGSVASGDLTGGGVMGSLLSGYHGLLASGYSFGRMTRELPASLLGYDDPMVATDAARAKAQRAQADALLPKSDDFVARNIYGAIASAPATLAAVAASAAGAPEVGVGLFGGQAAGDAYQDARDKGLTPLRATGYAATQGVIAGGAQVLPLGYVVKSLSKTGLPEFAAGLVGRDLASQELATVLLSANETATLHPEMTTDDWIASLPTKLADTAAQVVAMGTVGAAAHTALRIAGKNTAAVDQAREDGSAVDKLAASAEPSLTRKRDPAAFESFLDGQADGTPIDKLYVPAERVRELYQGVHFVPGAEGDTLLGFQPDIAEQLRQADATGGDVVLDTAKAMTHLPGTPTWDALKPDIRVRPDGLSMREAEQHDAAADDAMRSAGEEVAAADRSAREAQAPQQAVYDDVYRQTKEAGLAPNAARAYAELFAARYQARGEATGTTAEEAYRQSNLSIKAEMDAPEGGRSLDQDQRGRINLSETGRRISLFEGRDLSTLLHEGGHAFLDELHFDAGTSGASDQLKADHAAILKWFADNGHAVGEDGVVPTEAHELFARGFERYLMEGKAPSSGLRRAFASFRSWLTRIYKTVARLGSPITPEVRQVMDRLLASQDEIDAATEADNNRPLFKSAEEAGMTDAQFGAYRDAVTGAKSVALDRLLAKTMEPIREARTAEYRQRRRNLRPDVAKEIAALPEFVALDRMRTGPVGDRMRLSRQDVVDQFGEDSLKALPKGVYAREGGVHPDILAEAAGLPTGRDLIDRLVGIQKRTDELKAAGDKRDARDEAIDVATDARLQAAYGDRLNDGSIEEEARSAVHNDVRSSIIASEVRQLGRMSDNTAISYQQAREWAARQVRESAVRDAVSAASLQRHQRAENVAAVRAEKALRKGDVDEAFRHKRAQMLNHALFRETKIAKDEVEAAAKRLSKLAAAKTLPSMDQSYLDRIHGLLEAYDLKERTGPAIDEREAFAKFVAAKEAVGEEVYVPPRLLDAAATNYKSMTTDDLLGLDDAVTSLAHLGRMKKKLLVAKQERDFDEFVASAQQAASALPDRKFSAERNPKRSMLSGFAASLTKVEFIFDELDGYDPNGPFNRVFQGATEAANMKGRLKRETLDPIASLYHELTKPSRKRLHDRISVPELPTVHPDGSSEPTVFKRTDLLAVALNTGNESNLDKMTRGEGWSAEAVQTVLDRELTHDDWKFVDAVWKQVDSLWPHIARVERELSGVVPERVEPRKVQTKFGELDGGYYPVVYDPTRSDFAHNLYDGDADSMFGQQGRVVATPKGHTQTRTDAAYPLMLSLEGVLLNHVDRVATRIAYGRYVRDTLKFLSDPRIHTTIDRKRGPDDFAQLKPWLQGQVNTAKADTATLRSFEKFLKQARLNATVVGLGLRLTTIIQHVSYLSNSANEIGFDYMAKGLHASLGNMAANADFVFSRSDEMKGHAESFDQNVRDAFAQMGTRYNGKPVHDAAVRAQEFAQHVAFWGMSKVLMHGVVLPTWMGGYLKGIDEGMSEADAAAYGDKVVRRSSGAGRAKDLTAFQRGNEFVRQMGMFFSYGGTVFNQIRDASRAVKRVATGNSLTGDKRRAAMTALCVLTLEPLIVSMLKGDLPGDDEDWSTWGLTKILTNMFAGIPGVRDVATAAEKRVEHKPVLDTQIPALEAGKSIMVLANDVIHKLHGDEVSDRWLQHAVETPGYFFGLPTGAPSRAIQYAHDIHDGSQRPKSVADVWKGVNHGHQKDQE